MFAGACVLRRFKICLLSKFQICNTALLTASPRCVLVLQNSFVLRALNSVPSGHWLPALAALPGNSHPAPYCLILSGWNSPCKWHHAVFLFQCLHTSLSIMSNGRIPLLKLNNIPLWVYTGLLCPLIHMDIQVVSISCYFEECCNKQGSVHISSRYRFHTFGIDMPRSGVARLYHGSICNFLNNLHSFPHPGCAHLYSHQPHTRVSLLHILTCAYILTFW